MFLPNGSYVKGKVFPAIALCLNGSRTLFYVSIGLLIGFLGEYPWIVLGLGLLLWAIAYFNEWLRNRYSDRGRLFSPKSEIYWRVIEPLKGPIRKGLVDSAVLDETLEWYGAHIEVRRAGPWASFSINPIHPDEWRLQIELLAAQVHDAVPETARQLREIALVRA